MAEHKGAETLRQANGFQVSESERDSSSSTCGQP